MRLSAMADGSLVRYRLAVPRELLGHIIGKGGHIIHRTEVETGARLVVNKNEMGIQEQVVTMDGRLDVCINAACVLIHKIYEVRWPKAA